MTRDELDSAKDEQLNEMATKVMEWKPPKVDIGWVAFNGRQWSPATNIADAWELPPKLEPGWLVTVTRRTGDVGEWANKLRYHVDFRRIGEGEPRYICYAHEDQARAITTAALLAWGEKENSK